MSRPFLESEVARSREPQSGAMFHEVSTSSCGCGSGCCDGTNTVGAGPWASDATLGPTFGTVPSGSGAWEIGDSQALLHQTKLDVPDLEDRVCWQVTQGTGSREEMPWRRTDGAPACSLWQAHQDGQKITFDKWTVRALWDYLESTLPEDSAVGRFPASTRQLDWVRFSEEHVAWCDSQKDLIYATLGLLNLPEVIDMAEFAVCMFVAQQGWTEADQVTEHSRVMSEYRDRIWPRDDGSLLQTLNSITSTIVHTELWYSNQLILKKQKAVGEPDDELVAAALHPSTIIFVSEGELSVLAKATRLFARGSSETTSFGPTPKSRVCAVISMARLLFHEILHLACVHAVPEVADPPCEDNEAHPDVGAYTCDIVYLASETFGFFLDQLVVNQAWEKVPDCDGMLVKETAIGTRTDLPATYEGHAMPAESDSDDRPGQLSDPCLDAFSTNLEWNQGQSPTWSPERPPEYREPDLGDLDEERLPGPLWEGGHEELKEGLLG